MLDILCVPLALSMLVGGSPDAHIRVAEAAAPRMPVAPLYSLTALMDRPELKLGDRLSVMVQFQGERDTWNPFMTRFTADEYRCIRVWADEQWLWIKEEYESPSAELFVRRDTLADAVLTPARTHDRLKLDLVVREFHAGRAWIEVVDAAWTAEQTPEGTVLHAIRALDMIEREGWTLAVSELDRALRPNLPGHVRRELEELRERCDALR